MKQLAFSVPAAFLAFLGASAPCAAQAKLWVHPKCSPLPTDKMGPFARLDDGSVLAIDGSAAVVSRDGGRTWSEPRPLFPNGPKLRVSNERALLRTRDGTL
ncbi:MAG TPA: sialidase family protein, partial [Gemmataceae bacterium]